MAYSDTLKTLERTPAGGFITPKCRMENAQSTSDFCRRLWTNDQKRSWKRARVNGLVDGNPPYSRSALRATNQSERCNVNWGIARAYLESGAGAFYDLFSEAPGYFTIRTAHGTPEEMEMWSPILAEEADATLRKLKAWDYRMQLSQWDLTLHGTGPFMFENPDCIIPKAIHSGSLRVPERTKADVSEWDACCVDIDYYPPQLYEFIQDEDAATKVGWNVEYTKKVISNAMNIQQQTGLRPDWEYYQQEIKNNSFTYYDDGKLSLLTFAYWKEFDGRITQAIVERESTTGSIEYLFIHVGRYATWQEAVHPMYFDRGNGGFHHSVTGLGVKMYSPMEYQNRLLCNLCDKAFAPKILFTPTTTEASQKFSLMHMGDYAVLPAGFKPEQTGVAGLMNDGLAMNETIKEVTGSNLSTYRSGVPQKSGNPVTAFEKQLEAANQSALNKTQYNRYYEQLDCLYEEMWRRMTNLNSTNADAKDFQQRCKNRGVPFEAFRTTYVGATRVVGQGSAFMRKQAVDSLFPLAGSMPEEGRQNLLSDKIAVEAGQPAVARYFPRSAKQLMATDQQAEALQWVAAMKVGVAPVVTSSQNSLTYAATFLKAGVDALQSVQQGGDPMQVIAFLDICGPSIGMQLNRFANDITRRPVYQAMLKQWKGLMGATDQLKQLVAQSQQQQKEQQGATQAAMTDEQIAQAKAQNDIAIKNAKTAAQLKQSAEKHQQKIQQTAQNMALKDATTASQIHLDRLKALTEVARGNSNGE